MPLESLKWLVVFGSRDLTNRSFSYIGLFAMFSSLTAHVREFDFNFTYEKKKKFGKAFGYAITEDVNTVCHGFRVAPL